MHRLGAASPRLLRRGAARLGWAVHVARRSARGKTPPGPTAAVAQVASESTAAVPVKRDRDAAQRLADDLARKVGFMGVVDHKTVGSLDLFRILRVAKTPEDYRIALHEMNRFYNFGIKLKHRELASRLLAAAMACGLEEEANELVKLSGAWLEHPPDTALVYSVMGHHLDAGNLLTVRELAQAVREDWRMPVEAPLYAFGIEAMLRLPERSVAEALLLHEDARVMGVALPAPLHTRLLVAALEAFEEAAACSGGGAAPAEASAPEEGGGDGAAEASATEGGGDDAAAAESSADAGDVSGEALLNLRAAVRAADGLARDGHLRSGGSAAALFSVAWLLLRLGALPAETRAALMAHTTEGALELTWVAAARAALDIVGCQRGFSSQLPARFFRALEESPDAEAAALVKASRLRLGRFYPEGGG